MNAHDTLVDAVLSALDAGTPVIAGRIEEDIDLGSVAESEAECISVSLVESLPEQPRLLPQNHIVWTSRVAIACWARSDGRRVAGGASPATYRRSRQIHAAVYARLMADPTLGGKAQLVGQPHISTEGPLFNDARQGVCVGTYPVQHLGAPLTLEAAS